MVQFTWQTQPTIIFTFIIHKDHVGFAINMNMNMKKLIEINPKANNKTIELDKVKLRYFHNGTHICVECVFIYLCTAFQSLIKGPRYLALDNRKNIIYILLLLLLMALLGNGKQNDENQSSSQKSVDCYDFLYDVSCVQCAVYRQPPIDSYSPSISVAPLFFRFGLLFGYTFI